MKKYLFLMMSVPRKFATWGIYTLLGAGTLFLVSCATMNSPADSTSAPTHTMTLSDHEFAPVDFVPQAGDRILISNHSDISHSIYVTYPDGTMVNLGVQTPGKTVSWVVPKEAKGAFLLQCWIHPIIRATLDVNDTRVSSSVSPASSVVSSGLSGQEIRNGKQNICSSRNRRA